MRYVFFILFAGFGLVMLYVGVTQFLMQRSLIADPRRVAAKITRSDVTSHKSSDTDSRSLRDNSTTTYRPNIEFTYEIDGKQYTSELLKPTIISPTYGSRESAAREIKSFPVGVTVDAYYRPEYPGKAYLVRETGAGPIVFVLIGSLLPFIAWIVCKYVL